MSWQLLLTVSVFATVFYYILQRVLMRSENADPIVFTIASQIIPAVFIFLFAIISTGFHMPNLLAYPINTCIMIVAYTFAAVLTFKSMGRIDASEFSVLFVTRVMWIVLIAFGFLHEHFSVLQLIGSGFVIISVILVSWKKKKITFGKGEIYALLGAFFMGVGLGNDGYLSIRFDTLSYLVLAFLLPGIAIMVIYPKKIKGLSILFSPYMAVKMILLCICFAISAIAYFLAFKFGNNVGQVAILNQTSTILTVVFSIALLKETKNVHRKILGAIIAFVGVILLR